eukprot:15455897-Alexandrium_andersonii.AAC.1
MLRWPSMSCATSSGATPCEGAGVAIGVPSIRGGVPPMTGVRPPVPLRFGVEGGGSGGSPPPDRGAAEAVPPESVAVVQKASSAIK